MRNIELKKQYEIEIENSQLRLDEIFAEQEYLERKIQSYNTFLENLDIKILNDWLEGLETQHIEPRSWGWAYYIPYNTKFYRYIGKNYYKGYVPGQIYSLFDYGYSPKKVYRCGSIGRGNFHGELDFKEFESLFVKKDWQDMVDGFDLAKRIALNAYEKYQDIVVVHYRDELVEYYSDTDNWYDSRWVICSKGGTLRMGVGGYGRENSEIIEIGDQD